MAGRTAWGGRQHCVPGSDGRPKRRPSRCSLARRARPSAGLTDRSRAPQHSPTATDPGVIEKILRLREALYRSPAVPAPPNRVRPTGLKLQRSIPVKLSPWTADGVDSDGDKDPGR